MKIWRADCQFSSLPNLRPSFNRVKAKDVGFYNLRWRALEFSLSACLKRSFYVKFSSGLWKKITNKTNYSILSVTGNYTLRVDCTPLLHSLVYNLTKEVRRKTTYLRNSANDTCLGCNYYTTYCIVYSQLDFHLINFPFPEPSQFTNSFSVNYFSSPWPLWGIL